MLLIRCTVEDTSLSAIVLVSHRTEQFILCMLPCGLMQKEPLFNEPVARVFYCFFNEFYLIQMGLKIGIWKRSILTFRPKSSILGIHVFGALVLWHLKNRKNLTHPNPTHPNLTHPNPTHPNPTLPNAHCV